MIANFTYHKETAFKDAIALAQTHGEEVKYEVRSWKHEIEIK